MEHFLSRVAQEILQTHPNLTSVKIVLPSQRAVRFLKKTFSTLLTKPVRSPQIISITEFVSELSGLQSLPSLPLLFAFYESYCTVVPVEEQDSFEQFIHWVPKLLQDFNDLCAHRVPQDRIFSYLSDVEALKEWAKQDQQTPLTQNYIAFWKQMPGLFDHLTGALLEQKSGFVGMLFSEAVENLSLYLEHTATFHYLVGFNAMTTSEALLFQELLSQGRATIFWDLDRYFYEDPDHASSRFIRAYYKSWKVLAGNEIQWLGTAFSEPKSIEIIGANSSVQQVKHAAQLAQQLTQTYPEEKIALVLGDESYLIPTLSAFDADFDNWNVTMGYPLRQTPAADLLLQWIAIHQLSDEGRLPLSAVEKLLQTASLQDFFNQQGLYTVDHITEAKRKNKTFVSLDFLATWSSIEAWQYLCSPLDEPSALVGRMHQMCISLQTYFFETDKNKLFESYFYSLELLLQQLMDAISGKEIIKKLAVLRSLLIELLQQESLSFLGEATEGLQVMGLLETRLLDFDRVVVTHLNEGKLPAGKTANSFLPFEVKTEFGIPTFHEKDAIFTYHFYRMLQRVKEAYLLYDASEAGLGGAAPSRFLYQLELFAPPAVRIKKRQLQVDFEIPYAQTLLVDKSPALMERLYQMATQGFSPSALTHYLRDPMAFYEERILGIQPPIAADETVSYRDQGTILHTVLEVLYKPFEGKILTQDNIQQMLQKLPSLLQEHFEKTYGRSDSLAGKNYLIYQVLQQYATRFIQSEIKRIEGGDAIEIVALEAPFEMTLPIDTPAGAVRLKGTVDRIDRINGQLRILDYKTGSVSDRSLRIQPDEMDFDDPKTAVAFQVLTYAYQYIKAHPDLNITAGVIALKLGQRQLNLTWGTDGSQWLNEAHLVPFEAFLTKLILEILNPNIPFQRKNQ